MAQPVWEVADILRRYGDAYRAQHALPAHQLRMMRALQLCRTATLGGHIERCGHCDQQRISYNSCRNRHCPKCQSLARAQWIESRKAELLPIPYFHVVFTIPEQLNPLALQNKKVFYDLLFATTAATLQTIARDPKHLGAEIGFFSILHTWGQTLTHHPHIHSVVTGGGLRPDRTGWVHGRQRFLFSVRVLSRLFRRLFLEALQQAFAQGRLSFHGNLTPFAQPHAFRALLAPLRHREWVVYAKPPFGGPQQVIDYLGRYTHRVAISNHRLKNVEDGQVTFQYKQYRAADGQQAREITVPAEEFIRRFLLHSLPPGFQRIRHYGLLASRPKRKNLELCRQYLHMAAVAKPSAPERDSAMRERLLTPLLRCPKCQIGTLVRVLFLPSSTGRPQPVNTS
jgi:Putative transposase/Transposase zinc-binding domain